MKDVSPFLLEQSFSLSGPEYQDSPLLAQAVRTTAFARSPILKVLDYSITPLANRLLFPSATCFDDEGISFTKGTQQ